MPSSKRFIDPAEQGDLALGPSDNVGQGHTEDNPGVAVGNRPGFTLPIPGAEFGGGGLSKSKTTRTSGSWPAPCAGKSRTVKHLDNDRRSGLQPREMLYHLRLHEQCAGKTASQRP